MAKQQYKDAEDVLLKLIDKLHNIYMIDIERKTIASTLYDRPMYAIAVGVGLKVFIPGMGPLSIDYGIPLTNPGSNGNKNGYFTFGAGDMMY